MADLFTISPARIHYPDIFEPVRRFQNDPPEGIYRCHILVPKTEKKLLKEIKAAHDAAMPANARGFRPFDVETKSDLRQDTHFPFDGALAKDEALEPYWRISTTQYADNAVRVLDEAGRPAGSDTVYPGCWCKFVGLWRPYDNKQKGVRFILHGVMKVGDDDRLRVSGVSDSDVFSALGIQPIEDDEKPF